MIDVNGLQTNLIVTLLSAAFFFILGFLWYTLLFAKIWTKEMGYDQNKRPDSKTMIKGMLILLLSSFMYCWVLAFYFAGWKLLPGSPAESGTLTFGINCAISVMIGFFIPINLSRVVWEKHSWKLFFINTGYYLIGTVGVSIMHASY